MVCLPATQFGCGCSVTWGVKFVMLLHLAMNAAILGSSISFLIFGMKSMALANYGLSSILLAYALAGVPIIVVGFNGVLYRNESQVRMYLYYMWITIVVMVAFIIKECILSGPCQSLAGTGVFSANGEAWACGMARYVNIAIIVVSIALLGYFQHVVYSHCEDLATMGGGPELGDLVLNKDFYKKNSQAHSLYSSIEGMAEAGSTDGVVGPSWFGGMPGPTGLAGGQTIFGGTNHEMSYPPAGR